MSRVIPRLLAAVMAALVATAGMSLRPAPVAALSADIVISQVYGGGGNTGATYTHDFIELFNRGTASASLAGWSLQYASATGTGNFGASTTAITELPSVSLAPGQYLLVQEAQGAGGTTALPTPDVVDATPIAMSGTAGKIALVNTTTSLGCNGSAGQPCSIAALLQIIDLVGYGGANFFEGLGPAPLLSNTTAALRGGDGCTETDVNSADFSAATPAPRNTSTPLDPCGATAANLTINDVSAAEGDAGTTSFNFTVSLSSPAGAGGVTFDIATADGTATTGAGDYTASSLTGQTIPAGSTSYAFSVLVNGDAADETDETFFVNVTNVTGASILDGQGLGTIENDELDPCVTYTPIHQIQGGGSAAAITGNLITKGVVVGDFPGGAGVGLGGFYIQDPTGDGDSATSDGIFVYTGSGDPGVNTGDIVAVEGYARERFGETAINGSNSDNAFVTAITNCGTGTVAATDVTMPFASTTFLERHEGMLTRFPQSLVIAEYFNYDQFGEIVLALPLDGETRPFTPTSVVEPGIPAQERLLQNQLRRITLDDNRSGSNPATLRHPNGDPFALDNLFRGGDRVENAIGVIGFAFSLYRILPIAAAEYESLNPRPAEPEDVGGRVTVSAMNTLNFFITPDYPTGNPLDNKCGPLNTLECRGADFIEPLEFQRQRNKLLVALAGLDADVVGLNEIENSTGVDPLLDPAGIVPGLNALFGAGTYAAITTGTIGTDAIKVGMIYRPSVVTPVGSYQILTSAIDPRFVDVRSRPPLAQTFVENATGAKFTVVVNHLKSKGSACTQVGVDVPLDPDTGDGQGNCNKTRERAAQAIVDWLATDPTGSGDPDFLIIGDLNSYAMEDPIDAVKAGSDDTSGTADDYSNLIAEYEGTYAYSYTFDGMAGYLDHALAIQSLAGQVTGASEWHINSDEPDALDYDTSFKPPSQEALYDGTVPNRSSDHDAVRVGLDLDFGPPTITVTPGGTCGGGATGTILLAIGDADQGAGAVSMSLTGNTNTALVPNASVAIGGGMAAERWITVVPATHASGTAVLTFSLTDGFSTITFTLTVKVGTDAADTLTGTAGADLLIGRQGDDTLSGLGGADLLCGGNGNDSLTGGDGDDTLEGDRGNDALSGGAGDDVLRGGQGDDSLTGGADTDAFSGGTGTDLNVDRTPADGDTWDGS